MPYAGPAGAEAFNPYLSQPNANPPHVNNLTPGIRPGSATAGRSPDGSLLGGPGQDQQKLRELTPLEKKVRKSEQLSAAWL
jgi:hypothetical protein